jgi:hypothetical protein
MENDNRLVNIPQAFRCISCLILSLFGAFVACIVVCGDEREHPPQVRESDGPPQIPPAGCPRRGEPCAGA